ncbi:MAG TPA: DUF1700 domain-containing protein [Terracidiphilus sp.]|jgi:hypothetical protein|nr:DUF1700 domain-containing protein [Terracidiphilus sp.]
MIAEQRMEAYLSALRSHLDPMTLQEREEILREITAHIRDAQEEPGATLDKVLARLGTPEELAGQYRDGALIRRASRSYSPVVLLRGAMRLSTRGLSGIIVFFAGVIGYAVGGGFVLSAMLKPIFPGNTGVWVQDGKLVDFGTHFPAPPGAHEVLGNWYIVLTLIVGSMLLLGTMYLIRATLRVSKLAQMRLG